MIDYDKIFNTQPYELKQSQKEDLYSKIMFELNELHSKSCKEYCKIQQIIGKGMPVPVRLFKEYSLLSVPENEVIKVMTSSGTTGQAVSKIYLDRDTSARQTKALSKIVSSFTGKSRLPMLVIDSSAVIKNRSMFSARGAGILGFSMLGRDITYALDDDMNLDIDAINNFVTKHNNEKIMLFGFTYMIWEYLCTELEKRNVKLNIDGVLIHGGGWKKIESLNISNEIFKQKLKDYVGVKEVYNYYGMVEQTGSIFMECEYGHLHASLFSDIIIRKPHDFSVADLGEKGIIQCNSIIPTSYPGHELLTEDEGVLLGIDDCACGRKGKYFKIFGRLKGAEVRGCSDTYERS